MVKTKRKPTQQANAEASPPSLKERLAQKRKAERIRKELITFTTFSLLFCAVVGFVAALAGGPKVGVGVTVGLLCTSLSFKYPRHALWAFLIYLPFGGTITYSLGNSPLLQLAKDGFYIPALFGVVQFCRREQLPLLVPKRLVPPLIILLTFCMLTLIFVNGNQQLHPHIGTAVNAVLQAQVSDKPPEYPLGMGILGLKVLLGYVPLIICSYYLIRNRKDLMFLMRLTVVLVLICCALAFIQYLFLKTGRCEGTRFEEGADLFKASLNARCFVGGSLLYSPEFGQIRLPGTFVAPWQWGWFLISSGFLAFAPAFNDPKPYWRTLGLASMAAVVVMSVLSGQRIALAIVPVTFILLLVLTGQIIYLKRFIPTAVGLSLLLGVLAVTNPEVLQERTDSFVARWNASPPQQFIMDQIKWALSQQDGFLGNGLGRATNAARALGETQLIETYYPKLMYEIGPFGTLAFLAVVTMLTYLTFKAYRSVRDTRLRPYGAAMWLFVLFVSYNTYYYPLDVDPVAVYYWFFAGVILKLPEIERQERLEAAEQEKLSAEASSKKKKRLKRGRAFA
ncbi:MAG TPA: hormogonium polysaccharide biosynthesis protein HpsL [Crinalium sp.]